MAKKPALGVKNINLFILKTTLPSKMKAIDFAAFIF